MKAIWQDTIIAESENTKVIENNHYFPPESVKSEFLEPSSHQSTCPWKGEASYYNVVINGEKNENAAWYYPSPLKAAEEIKNHIAFWNGIEIVD